MLQNILDFRVKIHVGRIGYIQKIYSKIFCVCLVASKLERWPGASFLLRKICPSRFEKENFIMKVIDENGS